MGRGRERAEKCGDAEIALDGVGKVVEDVRIFGGVVLEISAVDLDAAVLQPMDMRTP